MTDILGDLISKNENKILLMVVDGLGGVPYPVRTELETAQTPNLDRLARKSALGLMHPVGIGITPGSGPAHLALFGYDPVEYKIGRGLLEALGIGLKVGPDDLAVRANFATHKNDVIIDRRAGRISSEECRRLCTKLQAAIKSMSGGSGESERDSFQVLIYPVKEHRFVVIFRGKGLAPELSDADPEKENRPMVYPRPVGAPSADKLRSAALVKGFIMKTKEVLQGEPRANTVLMRGYACQPKLPSLGARFGVTPCAIATYPMYKGIAQLVGMTVVAAGETYADQIAALAEHHDDFDFFYFHAKATDKAGEDGDFKGKVKAIEQFDKVLSKIVKTGFAVVCLTGDHSTPARLKSHSWHPSPLLLYSDYVIPDRKPRFTERYCAQGSIGHIMGLDVMPLLLANALKLKKYGA